MLKALLLSLVLLGGAAAAQDGPPVVTTAQLDAAVAEATGTLADDDPKRADLLRLYGDARAALAAAARFEESRESFAQARAGAAKQAADIEAGLAERQVAPDAAAPASGTASLADIEQQMQVGKAELDARRSRLTEIRDAISGMPGRAAEIRARLTELGSLIPKLQAQLDLLPDSVEAGSTVEAGLWLAQAQLVSAQAEKASLDEELLSQPMRLQLLAANQDLTGQDIAALERRLLAMDRRASVLRQGEATQAQARAEEVLEDTRGKHPLVRQLADENAALSASFSQRSTEIEHARQTELAVAGRVERLQTDLKSIEHKLNVLGMSAAVGHILREQQAHLPREHDTRVELKTITRELTDSSIRQLEFEDESSRLSEAGQYVDHLTAGLDRETAAAIRPDLLKLALSRRELVRQALDLESTYAGALGNLEFELGRYAVVVGNYQAFISERLLWIPSRAPFSVLRGDALVTQLQQLFVADRWTQVLGQLPAELVERPFVVLLLLLVLALVYYGPRIRTQLVATGREVGYVRTDKYSNTLIALGLSALQSLKWPLLMWSVAELFKTHEVEAALASALHNALSRGALYFWGLEFLRVLFLPKGLIVSHFRWPTTRVDAIRVLLIRLEQTFLPAAMVVMFAIALYPGDVGGSLGALSITLVLLSMAYFFRSIPEFVQGRVALVLTDGSSRHRSAAGGLVRLALVWVPVVAIIGVLFGYIYTAIEFSLLLLRTVGFCFAALLVHELGMRWLRMTRRRMVVRVRAEAAQASSEKGEISPEEELLENDPELLSDEGTKLLNLLTTLAVLAGILVIWSEVFPALGILDSIKLWHHAGIVGGEQVPVAITLRDFLVAVFIAVLGWIALHRIPGLLEILLRQKAGLHPASAYAATRVFQYATTGILVFAVLSSLGGSWSQIQWAVAALSVGIGFGLQEIVANFISGLIILFEQPIRVGDTVTVGGVSGKVTKIRIRATTIRDFDRRELLVPNKEFITQQLLNWSLSDQVTRWVTEVGVAYGSDLDLAMAEVREAVSRQPLILRDPAPLVTFEQFGDNSLLIRARYFMDQLDQRLQVSSDLMLDINRRLNEKGIVVAFPQRDVHLDTSQPLEIRMVERSRQGATTPDRPGKE